MEYLKRNFEVVKGTLSEIEETPTKNMTIYCSTDTNQIFIGDDLLGKVSLNSESNIYSLVEKQLSEFSDSIFGRKTLLEITPEMFKELHSDDGVTIVYNCDVTVDAKFTDWVDVRPVSKTDRDILAKYDIWYNIVGDIINITANVKPEETFYLEYFIMKGL